MTAFTVGTFNVHYILNPKATKADLEKFTSTSVDVAGLQEFGREDRVPILDGLKGWDYHRAESVRGQDMTPIIWRPKRFELVESGSRLLIPSRPAEKGAGGNAVGPKALTWVVLEDRVDPQHDLIGVFNWHAPASVESNNHPLRQAAMRECVREVKQTVRQMQQYYTLPINAMFITGDMNVNFKKNRMNNKAGFPVREFAEIGLTANWEHQALPLFGTHQGVLFDHRLTGTRIIDYIFSNIDPAANSRILRGYNSDHHPVLSRYELV